MCVIYIFLAETRDFLERKKNIFNSAENIFFGEEYFFYDNDADKYLEHTREKG